MREPSGTVLQALAVVVGETAGGAILCLVGFRVLFGPGGASDSWVIDMDLTASCLDADGLLCDAPWGALAATPCPTWRVVEAPNPTP